MLDYVSKSKIECCTESKDLSQKLAAKRKKKWKYSFQALAQEIVHADLKDMFLSSSESVSELFQSSHICLTFLILGM